LLGGYVEGWLHPRLQLQGDTFCTISISHPCHFYVGSANTFPDNSFPKSTVKIRCYHTMVGVCGNQWNKLVFAYEAL